MARTPISAFGVEETTDNDGPVDVSLLPWLDPSSLAEYDIVHSSFVPHRLLY